MARVTKRRITATTAVLAAASLAGGLLGAAPAQAENDKKPRYIEGFTGAGSGTLWGDDTSLEGVRATKKGGKWDASLDGGSAHSVAARVGARAAWASGVTGKDVTVAVIDTGVSPVLGLHRSDKVLHGPDLSFDSQTAGMRNVDGFGHGTHMAALIAGRDEGFDPKNPDSGLFAGMAPDAELLSVKVGAGDGAADVSQVIGAIDWVVEHRRDAGMNVRVINLSYGTESVQPWQVDPLARAVERAWDHGIVVVVAAGNGGADASSLLMPAVDPNVLAVGAVDHQGTQSTDDDTVSVFTSRGSSERRPDVLAPGKSVVSLRVPGSYADEAHPEGLVYADKSERFFRGSGTSQAAAVVSGEVALLLQARPSLTPDQVKALLVHTARPLAADGDPAQGAGVTDVGAAVALLKAKAALPATSARTTRSSGLGSLEASRGGEHVIDPATGEVLRGERDAQGAAWDAAAWVAAQRAGATWSNGAWNGRVWTGSKWDNKRLRPAQWTGLSWSSQPWAEHAWSDDFWEARSWRARSWREAWAARSWREDSWSARSWRGML